MSDERLHMTVAITDDYAAFPTKVADLMLTSGSRVTGAPIPIVLDRLKTSGRSIALRPHSRPRGLSAIHVQLWRALACVGAARPGWRFGPHVTLGYDRRAIGERIAPIEWMAREIVLIHSMVGATRHEVLGRWALIDDQLGFDF